MAMRIRRYNAKCIAHDGRSRATLDTTQNGPSTQLIEVASCVERLNAKINAKELSHLSSYQTLTTDKN
jgi:hypothetical protein